MKEITIKQWIVVVILISIITFGWGFLAGKNLGIKNASMQANKDQVIISQTPQEPTFITIYITGTVKNPDVYKIDEGNIIKDAINIAGGALDNADLISVNLARKVQDGEEIIIPFKDENIGINMADNNFTKSQKININTASVEKLKSLPRIGDVKANVMLIP